MSNSDFCICKKCGCVFEPCYAKEKKEDSWEDKEYDIYKQCPCCKNWELMK